MKVIHITPTYFDDASIIGGGERYPTELALWMAKSVDTTLISFSNQRQSLIRGQLKLEVYPVKHLIHGNKVNPLSFRYLSGLLSADIVHIHCINTLVSDMGCLIASLFRKKVVVTDYGGGGSLVLNQKLPVFDCYHQAIVYSRYGLNYIPTALQKKVTLIKGGIDTEKFCLDESLETEKKILYVGRLLPHKGINYLIDAFRLLQRSDYQLTILGRVHNEAFYEYLKEIAKGLSVNFVHDADDSRLLHEYRTSQVTVLPSVHTDCYGNYSDVPELMGFTLLESQACGTPVVCTDAGAMHEFVENGRTGFVVEQNSGEAIADALNKLINSSTEGYAERQSRCQEWIEHLNWTAVVKSHLETYKSF
jgi:glycosyltransferase involved in cell wall biosynthesis